MRRLLDLALVLPAAAAAIGLSAIPGGRTLVTSGEVTQLSARLEEGSAFFQNVAFLRSEGGCQRLGIWQLIGKPQDLRIPCRGTVVGLTVTERGAVWLNVRRLASGRTRYQLLQSVAGAADVHLVSTYGRPRVVLSGVTARGAPPPAVTGDGAYAVGRVVHGYSTTPPSVLRLSARPVGVAFDPPRYVGAWLPDGTIELFNLSDNPHPKVLQTHYAPGEILAFKLKELSLVVLRRGSLDFYSNLFPEGRKLKLPPARTYGDDQCHQPPCTVAELRLADFEGPYAIYIHGRAIHALRVSDAKDVIVREPPGKGAVHAQMDTTGLIYSTDNRVTLIPRRAIDALFR